jgi:hypothetical protein
MAEEFVSLNVGGKYYQTSLSTLRAHPASFLSQMFTHPIAALQDPRDGSYFLDRNGDVFGMILDYLRTGTLTVPRDPATYVTLRREVCFFGLPVSSQLPEVRPIQWEANAVRVKHARITVDEFDRAVEWEDGPLPADLLKRTTAEIVNYLGGRGYKMVSEYASRGTRGYHSIWMAKEELNAGAVVALEVRDPL